ncbi:MAG: DUF4153 domain-containing protein [Pyrinomonadaceae bacterium]
MNERTKTGLEILQAAVLLGILGDVLLRETPWGLNILLLVGALVAAMTMLVLRRRNEFWTKHTIALNCALIFFAACFAWRDSAELQVFDALAILTVFAVLTLPALKIKTQTADVFHYVLGFIWSGISAAFAPFFLVFKDIDWKTIPQTGWSKHLISVLRGLLIAAPILLVFGGLFVAADAIYEGIIRQTFNIEPAILVGHIFFTGFFSWIVAGYLRGSLISGFASDKTNDKSKNLSITASKNVVVSQPLSVTEIKDEDAPQPKETIKSEKKNWTWQNFDNTILPRALTLGAIEISVVLGLINLLFLSFVIVQIPYLFGGFELVQNTPDFKLADYARRGFGELVTVAALVLPILLTAHWLLRKDSPINEKIYRILAGIQIVLLFVIMASAAQRLLILTGNLGYGLTTVRFYPMVCMMWLALVFGWFALTVLRGAREKFAWGALWSAMFVLGILHVVNPDAYIVRANVNLMREGRRFDAFYNVSLSDDAVPVLLENLSLMSFENQCVVKLKLSRRLAKANEGIDFRTWNYSRWNVQTALTEHAENLDVSNCPSRQVDFYENDF